MNHNKVAPGEDSVCGVVTQYYLLCSLESCLMPTRDARLEPETALAGGGPEAWQLPTTPALGKQHFDL